MRHRLNLEKLRALLADSRLSQNHWALKLGLSRGHWSDLLAGRHAFPSAKTRVRVAEAFGVRESDLFEPEPGEASSDDVLFRRAVASRFTIVEELGQGGMGAVYVARDARLGRMVALKVVAREAAAGVGADQLLTEIGHVARLTHPHVLPLHDAGVEAGHPYYVMPYVRGGSLRALLDQRVRLTVGDALPILDGIAAALEYAHAQQTLHCDVKPENVLVQDGHAYVMDFGIARTLHSEADEWTGLRKELDFSAGTPAYVSPEQAAGDRAIDQRSDVYSLACVAYEMLAGRAPFTGRTTEEVVSLRFRAPPPSLREFAPDVPVSVERVIARAMSIDPDRRPVSAVAFAAELRHAAAGMSALITSLSVQMTRTLARGRAALGVSGPARLRLPIAGFVQDVQHTMRSLRREWRFSLGVVFTLAIGVGLCFPALSLADHLLLRAPPGVRDPERIVRVVRRGTSRGQTFYQYGLTGQDLANLSSASRTLDPVAGFYAASLSLGSGERARTLSALLVSASYFDVLGVRMAAGRPFAEHDDIPDATSSLCVVSYRFWKRSLNGRSDAIGQTLDIGGVSYVVSGIAAAEFNGLAISNVDVYLPLHVAGSAFAGRDPALWATDKYAWFDVIGRLRPNASPAAATLDANAVYRLPAVHIRDKNREDSLMIASILPSGRLGADRNAQISRWLVAGAGLLFLLIVANLVNLFIARGASNARQVAVRLALGGGLRHLLRLHLVEAVTLGVIGATLGAALAAPTVAVARSLILPAVEWTRPLVDVRLFGGTVAITLMAAAVVALWTTMQSSHVDPAELLRASAGTRATGSRGARRVRDALLVVQAAVFAMLLSTATAFVLSLRRATGVDVGFDVETLVAAQAPLSGLSFTREQVHAYYVDARARVSTLPNVESASIGFMEPWRNNSDAEITIPGGTTKLPYTLLDLATPEYLTTFGATMKEGRWFVDDDRIGSAPVVVVNESLARAGWAGRSPVGSCVHIGGDTTPCNTVVGVVHNFRVTGGIEGDMAPALYVPFSQSDRYRLPPRLLVRLRERRASTLRDIERLMQSLVPGVPAASSHYIADNLSWLTAPLKLGATVFAAFGLLAALIAAVGLSGVLSFLVTAHRRSYAIRSALGAPRQQIVVPVVRRAVACVGGGIVLGFIALVAVRATIEKLLFHTHVLDGVVAASVLAFGVLIAFSASVIPIRKVLRIDPMQVLREE